jgi:hypothetical protein
METLNPSSSDLRVPSGYEAESASWKSKLSALPKQQLERVRPRVMEMKSKVQGQLRARPAMFAGIAAGVALALGLTGRIARHRRNALKKLPTLVIVESC